MTPPTIQVNTSWPGANAKLIQELVGSNIESQVNGVQDMLYMQSYSTDAGTYALTVTFAVGTDPNAAQVNVQNRVAIAIPMLPQSVQKQGVTTKTQSTAILQFVTVTSKDNSRDALFLSNFANLQMQNRLARIPGVAAANVFGVGNYSMRVWLDPALMRERSLTPSEVMSKINNKTCCCRPDKSVRHLYPRARPFSSRSMWRVPWIRPSSLAKLSCAPIKRAPSRV